MDKILKDYDSREFIVKLDDLKKEDDKYVYVEGYATTFGNKDSYNDIMLDSVLDEQIKNQDFGQKALINHKSWEIESNVGSVYELTKDNKGVRYKIKVLKTPKNEEHLIPMLKAGEIKSVSIGFRALDFEKNDAGGFTFRKIELVEISFVNFPANKKANVEHVKQEKKNMAENLDFEKSFDDYKKEVQKLLDETSKKTAVEQQEAIKEIQAKFAEFEKNVFEKMAYKQEKGNETQEFFKRLEGFSEFTKARDFLEKSQNTVSNVDGGYLVTPASFSRDFFDAVYNDTGSLTSVVSNRIVPTKEYISYVLTKKPTAFFRGELEPSTPSGMKYHEEKMQQKVLTVSTSYTFQFFIFQALFNQANLMSQMAEAARNAKNYAILNGDKNLSYGGILKNNKVPTLTTTSAGLLSWEDFLQLVAKIKGGTQNLTVVMHYKTLAKYLTQKDTQGRPIFTTVTDPEMGLGMKRFHGYKLITVGDYVREDEELPMLDTVDNSGNFVTGSYPVLIGDFSNYLTVNSSKINLINDPYTSASIELSNLYMHMYTDGNVIMPERFAKIQIQG